MLLANGTIVSASDITTALVHTNDTVAQLVSTSWLGNVSDTWFIVEASPADDATYVGEIRWSSTFDASDALRAAVEEQSGSAGYPLLPGQTAVSLPFNLGALRIGNEGKGGNGALNLSDSRLFRLWGDKGGVLDGQFNETGHTVQYPQSIGAFAPLAAVGEWTRDGVVIALQCLDDVYNPEGVGMTVEPRSQFMPAMTANVTLLLGRGAGDPESEWSRTRLMSIGFSTGGDWQSSIGPYVRQFRSRQGMPGWWSPSNPGPSPRPSYCPQTGPLMYFVGSNDGHAYNYTTHRYMPGN